MSTTSAIDRLNVLAAEFDRLATEGVRSAPEMALIVADMQDDLDQLERERQDLRSLYEVASELAATARAIRADRIHHRARRCIGGR